MEFSFDKKRIFSIDVFRGITILVMIWVNEMAGVSGISPWLKHMPADADAMTFVDVVFPAFLFIVGMSLPFAINTRLQKGDSTLQLWQHILMRFLGLIVLGLFMMNAETGFAEAAMPIPIALWGLLSFIFAIAIWNMYPKTLAKPVVLALKIIGWAGLLTLAILYESDKGGGMQIHWWGILGLIGWAYLIATAVYFFSKGRLKTILATLAAFLIVYILLKLDIATDNYFVNFLRGQTGHLIHTMITLSGVILSLLFFNQIRPVSPVMRLRNVTLFTAAATVVASIARPYYTISKIWATPSWAFYSVAICILLYALFYYLIEIKGITKGFGWLQPAAANPLLIYILPYMIYHLSTLLNFSILPEFAASGSAGIFWTLAYALLMVVIVKWLNKIHLRLHL